MAAFLSYVVVAGFIAHELDAAHKREWLLRVVLRGMPEDPARPKYGVGTAHFRRLTVGPAVLAAAQALVLVLAG